ncbi:MAG: chondroitinase-B domain-containing protein [Sedimenticola sp.]
MQRTLTIIFFYFALAGMLAHIAGAAFAYRIYVQSGQPFNLFIYNINQKIEKRSPSLSGFITTTLFDSGLLNDPSYYLNASLTIDLPPWQGIGANKLRRDTSLRYSNGSPVSLLNRETDNIAKPQILRVIDVSSVDQLIHAIEKATPGDQIRLAPGVYRIPKSLSLHAVANGSPKAPISIRGESIDQVRIEFERGASFHFSGAYWAISDIVFRGLCGTSSCLPPITVGTSAKALVIRNIFASDFSTLLSGAPENSDGVIDGVTLVGHQPRLSDRIWRTELNRLVNVPSNPSMYKQLCPEATRPGVCEHTRLDRAFKDAKDGQIILLRAGEYRRAGIIRANRVTVLAEPGAHVTEAAADGKGAIVLRGNGLVVDGLECSRITVGSGNGACLRQDQGDFTLRGVHFHHSQMGVLTGHKGGRITIEDSYFHDSGRYRPGALGHNIYVNSGELYFLRSWSLRAANQGHELKSRANVTTIKDSILASINSQDSRLIDLPHGGVLSISNSVLAEGPMSSNWDMIGYGLESKNGRKLRPRNTIEIRDNVFVSDRFGTAHMLHADHATETRVEDNLIIGPMSDHRPDNILFSNRRDAGFPEYPELFESKR